jgi:hypothetical protein
MRSSIAIFSVLATAALAKNSTVEFFFPGGYDGADPVASIVSANPSTTVLNLACPTGTDSTECGFGSGFEYKIISTTIYQASMSELGFIMTFSCDHNIKKDEMSCGVSLGGSNANDPGTTTAVLPADQIEFLTATVTAGEELLDAEATGTASSVATSTGVALTAASSATVAPRTSLQTTATASVTALASGASSSEPAAQSTNAAYKYGVEGSALLALAGAAAMNIL